MKTKTRVIVLGNGIIGKAIKNILENWQDPAYEVTIADPFVDAPGTDLIKADIFEDPYPLLNFHYVVNAAPVLDPKKYVKLILFCIMNGIHYFDLTEDVHVGEIIRLMGENQSNILVAPHCGLAPGFINVLGAHAARDFTEIVDLDLRVGALPSAVSNEFKYTCTWSVDGLVNEYINDAELIDHHERVRVNCFKNPKDDGYVLPLIVNGVEYESFPTSGGCSTMMQNFTERKPRNLAYRTIRYKGHLEAVREAFEGVKWNRLLAAKLLGRYKAVPPINDFVLVFARASGYTEKLSTTLQERTICLISKGDPFRSAIEKTTATSLCAVLDMHVHNKLPIETGFLRHETIPYSEFSESAFFPLMGLTDV